MSFSNLPIPRRGSVSTQQSSSNLPAPRIAQNTQGTAPQPAARQADQSTERPAPRQPARSSQQPASQQPPNPAPERRILGHTLSQRNIHEVNAALLDVQREHFLQNLREQNISFSNLTPRAPAPREPSENSTRLTIPELPARHYAEIEQNPTSPPAHVRREMEQNTATPLAHVRREINEEADHGQTLAYHRRREQNLADHANALRNVRAALGARYMSPVNPDLDLARGAMPVGYWNGRFSGMSDRLRGRFPDIGENERTKRVLTMMRGKCGDEEALMSFKEWRAAFMMARGLR